MHILYLQFSMFTVNAKKGNDVIFYGTIFFKSTSDKKLGNNVNRRVHLLSIASLFQRAIRNPKYPIN